MPLSSQRVQEVAQFGQLQQASNDTFGPLNVPYGQRFCTRRKYSQCIPEQWRCMPSQLLLGTWRPKIENVDNRPTYTSLCILMEALVEKESGRSYTGSWAQQSCTAATACGLLHQRAHPWDLVAASLGRKDGRSAPCLRVTYRHNCDGSHAVEIAIGHEQHDAMATHALGCQIGTGPHRAKHCPSALDTGDSTS